MYYDINIPAATRCARCGTYESTERCTCDAPGYTDADILGPHDDVIDPAALAAMLTLVR